jgi:hypothetical protein
MRLDRSGIVTASVTAVSDSFRLQRMRETLQRQPPARRNTQLLLASLLQVVADYKRRSAVQPQVAQVTDERQAAIS